MPPSEVSRVSNGKSVTWSSTIDAPVGEGQDGSRSKSNLRQDPSETGPSTVADNSRLNDWVSAARQRTGPSRSEKLQGSEFRKRKPSSVEAGASNARESRFEPLTSIESSADKHTDDSTLPRSDIDGLGSHGASSQTRNPEQDIQSSKEWGRDTEPGNAELASDGLNRSTVVETTVDDETHDAASPDNKGKGPAIVVKETAEDNHGSRSASTNEQIAAQAQVESPVPTVDLRHAIPATLDEVNANRQPQKVQVEDVEDEADVLKSHLPDADCSEHDLDSSEDAPSNPPSDYSSAFSGGEVGGAARDALPADIRRTLPTPRIPPRPTRPFPRRAPVSTQSRRDAFSPLRNRYPRISDHASSVGSYHVLPRQDRNRSVGARSDFSSNRFATTGRYALDDDDDYGPYSYRPYTAAPSSVGPPSSYSGFERYPSTRPSVESNPFTRPSVESNPFARPSIESNPFTWAAPGLPDSFWGPSGPAFASPWNPPHAGDPQYSHFSYIHPSYGWPSYGYPGWSALPERYPAGTNSNPGYPSYNNASRVTPEMPQHGRTRPPSMFHQEAFAPSLATVPGSAPTTSRTPSIAHSNNPNSDARTRAGSVASHSLYAPTEPGSDRSTDDEDEEEDYDGSDDGSEVSDVSLGFSLWGSHDTLVDRSPPEANMSPRTSKDLRRPNNSWTSSTCQSYKVLHSRYERQIGPSGKRCAIGHLSILSRNDTSGELGISKWIHCQQATLNFEEFSMAIQASSDIPMIEKSPVLQALNDMRNRHLEELPHQHDILGRHMRPHFASNSGIRRTRTGSREVQVRNICFPYFSLQPYPSTAASGVSVLHPARPLLQSYFASARKEQDLRQAVCLLRERVKGDRKQPTADCFQIGQLWAIIVNDSLLVTASSMSIVELAKGTINIRTMPRVDKEHEKAMPAPTIHVRHSEAQHLWLLPRHECDTFFDLQCLFKDLAFEVNEPNTDINFISNYQVLEGRDWQEVLARNDQAKVRLEVRITRRALDHQDEEDPGQEISEGTSDSTMKPSDSSVEDGSQDDSGRAGAFSVDLIKPLDSGSLARHHRVEAMPDFHVFTWFSSGSNLPPTITKDDTALTDMLNKADRYLEHSPSSHRVRYAYRRVPSRTWQELEGLLQTRFELLILRRIPWADEELQRGRKCLDAIRKAFTFLMPLDTESRIVGKLWGSLYMCFEQNIPFEESFALETFEIAMDDIISNMHRYHQRFQYWRPRAGSDEILDSFMKALIAAVAGFCLKAVELSRATSSRESSRYLQSCLQQTRRALTLCWNTKKTHFTDYEAVDPMGLMTLIVLRLLGDDAPAGQDIHQTYWSYFKSLEMKVEMNPYTRTYQAHLALLKQEIRAVLYNLHKQKEIIHEIGRLGEKNRRRMAQSKSTIAPSPNISAQGLVIDDCYRRLKGRIAQFVELEYRATALQTWNLSQHETRKSRHDAALYAFTIVTIVFLPLSFVASVFGMNTSDIVNMEQGQWIFWVSAIGLTVSVIVFALLWAGEFGNTYREIQRLLRGDWSRPRFTDGPLQIPISDNPGSINLTPWARDAGTQRGNAGQLVHRRVAQNMQTANEAVDSGGTWYPASAQIPTQIVQKEDFVRLSFDNRHNHISTVMHI